MYRPGRISRTQSERDAMAGAFADADVARCYLARPPYAPALFDFLLGEVGGRGRALDLGCGPGKIALSLTDRFAEVVALDPSAAMILVGREADGGRQGNVVWTVETAEAYEDGGGFDLVTAGTSIHWLDHAVVFPKLAAWTTTVAVITGDAPSPPPCGEGPWVEFLGRWIARVGGRYDAAASATEASRHEAWMDIAGRKRFDHTVRQTVEDFVISQHSRATWSRAVMGAALAEAFDQALTELMAPFAVGGWLTLQLVSELTWGAPRRTART